MRGLKVEVVWWLLLLSAVAANQGIKRGKKEPWRDEGTPTQQMLGKGTGADGGSWQMQQMGGSNMMGQPAAWLDPQVPTTTHSSLVEAAATAATRHFQHMGVTPQPTAFPPSSSPPSPSPSPSPTNLFPHQPPTTFSPDLQLTQRLWEQQQLLWLQQQQQQQQQQQSSTPPPPPLTCTSQREVCLPANYSRFQLPNKGEQTTVSIGFDGFDVRKIDDIEYTVEISCYFLTKWHDDRLILHQDIRDAQAQPGEQEEEQWFPMDLEFVAKVGQHLDYVTQPCDIGHMTI